ncbi:MAG: hypothetical protein ACUVV0_04900 [Anaerolineae bacterium]
MENGRKLMIFTSPSTIYCILSTIFALAVAGCSILPEQGGAFPSPAPFISPTPIFVLVYEDDFSSQDSGWDDAFDKYTMKQYGGFKYHITISAPNLFAWGLANRDLADFVLQVEAAHEEGAYNNSYGILFRFQDEKNFYRFDVSGDGFYLLSKFVNGQWENLVDWTESEHIKKGHSTNFLKVSCLGPRISVYVNGELLAEVEDSTFQQGDIGFFAGTFGEPQVHISFDNLKVWAPQGTMLALRPTATPPPSPQRVEFPPTPTLPNMPKPQLLLPKETATAQPTITPTPTLETMPDYVSASQPKPHKASALEGKIAFPAYDPERGTYDIYIANVDGSDRRRILTEASQPALNSKGTHIAYRSWASDQRGLIARPLEGEDVWRFVLYHEAARPSWAPDDQMFLFHSRQEADRRSRLYYTEGTALRTFRRTGIDVFGESPCWMPDRRIVYRACEYGRCGLYIMNFDGSFPQQLTTDVSDTSPASSPDGFLAFMTHRDGNWEIYTLDLKTGALNRLTENEANDGLPTWSPDGKRIAFVSDRNGQWSIWVMNPDGSEQYQLFPMGGSPDGPVRNVPEHESQGWTEERISWSP